MRRIAIVAAVLLLAAPAGAADFGSTDDTGKYLGNESASYFEAMRAVGLTTNTVTLRWGPDRQTASSELAFVTNALGVARANGIDVVLRLFPADAAGIGTSPRAVRAFAAWASDVAERYPQVREFVVGNEPNQPRFWKPQFTGRRQASAAAFGAVLAATYDALKRVDPAITVTGVGLSSRGNDRPFARSNASTSPVRFLGALGTWYRKSGRTRPLMDAFSYHPYPNSSTDLPGRRLDWPKAGMADLGRVKLALWDAFHGTPQPTPADGLPIVLGEVAWQVDTAWSEGYSGTEQVRVATETHQAAAYRDIVKRASCDPGIARVSFFAFFDERERAGFQSGLYRLDGTARPSADAVRAAIRSGCPRTPASWRPLKRVVGGRGYVSNWKRNCFGMQKANLACVTAREDARFRAGLFPVGTSRAAIAKALARGGELRGKLPAYARVPLRFAAGGPRSGPWVVGIRIVAASNPSRSTLVVAKAR